MQSRRTLLRGTAAFSTLALAGAPLRAAAPPAAAGYPAQPVRVLVGFAAGGVMDVATRVLTAALARALGTPFVVENKPGASGTIAAEQAARAAPDGHVLVLGTSSNLAIAPFLYPGLRYDPEHRLAAVARFALSQNLVYAGRATGVSSLAGLREAIRRAPGRYNYATPGAGTTPHLTFETLKARERLYVVHVPFGSSRAAVETVAGGDVEFGVDAISAVLPMLAAGRVVPLAQTGRQRSRALPEVPTLAELGHADLPAGTFLGLMAPAGTPEPVLALLEAETRRAMDEPAVVERLAQLAMQPAPLARAAFRQAIRADAETWRQAVRYSKAAEG